MRFKLLTYNIHKGVGVDGKFMPERIIDVLEHHDADIVLLQEVDRNSPRSRHLDLASLIAGKLNYPYRSVGINFANRAGKYGNATLSRFPIGHQRNIDLTIGWRKRRGAQHTRMHLLEKHDHATIDVFNLHLGLAARTQRHQVTRLLSTADICNLTDDAPCIIAGDTNDWVGLLPPRFRSCGFDCASNRRPGSRWSIRTFPSFAPAGGLDKIFFRGALRLLHAQRSRMKLARIASDHLPVIAEFEFLPRAVSVLPRERA